MTTKALSSSLKLKQTQQNGLHVTEKYGETHVVGALGQTQKGCSSWVRPGERSRETAPKRTASQERAPLCIIEALEWTVTRSRNGARAVL